MTSEASVGSIARDLAARNVCSLSPEELAQRLELIRREIQPGVIARADLPDGVAWEFENHPEMRARLERLAELERECCGVGLEFRVRDDAEAGRLRFEIHGSEAGAFRAVLGDSAAASAPASRPGVLRRLAKATGFGVAASLFVCCVIPIGVATVAGAAIAGPLLELDHPLVIGAGTAVFGTAVWRLEPSKPLTRSTILQAIS